jgi:hypothetical protein
VPALTPGDAQDLLAVIKRGWEARDPDSLVALFRGDAAYRDDPFAEELVGSVAIRRHWNELAAQMANVEFDAERTWVAGSTVLASWHAAYTRRSSGERVRRRGFWTLELDNERLIERMRQWALQRVVGTDSTFKIEE